MKTAIRLDKLSKTFISQETPPGLWGALRGLFFAKKREILAIKALSLEIQAGERVAFIGPNGAGKSTTIKMLTGILHPTSGDLEILGLVPWKDRHALGYLIGTVFGQRTQLWYHLPPSDTFALLARIYELEPKLYQIRLQELIELFEVKHLLHKPVRQLSLGERMRWGIIASILHMPKILFLDEPTIGLDINAKLMIRGLLNQLSKRHSMTLFLTSHDTADIEQVCDRVIVLDKGCIITDSTLKDLKKTYMKKKILTLATEAQHLTLTLPGVTVLENGNHHFRCEVDVGLTGVDRVIQEALKITSLKDITIEEISMEEVIRILYANA